jgi:hypothetical protein
MSSKYPKVRLGEWVYDSINYICLTPEGKPEKYIVKRPFTITSQKDAFIFAVSPEIIDGFAVWKEDGSNIYNQLYLVQDRIGIIGEAILYINKKDKSKRVTKFVGNFIQSGFIPNANTQPVCGIVNLYWVKDL